MRVLHTLFLGGCLAAVLANCQSRPGSPRLLVTAADPQTHIEASYGEGERAIVVRARSDGPTVVSEVFDERDHSMTALAAAALRREVIPVAGLLSNAAALDRALGLTARSLHQLRETLPPEAVRSTLFADLSRQPALLRRGLTATRLSLLQEWGNEARRRIPMSADETQSFFAILRRQALAIGAPAQSIAPAGAEVASLLGPERYARYTALRRSWTSPAGARAQEMLP